MKVYKIEVIKDGFSTNIRLYQRWKLFNIFPIWLAISYIKGFYAETLNFSSVEEAEEVIRKLKVPKTVDKIIIT